MPRTYIKKRSGPDYSLADVAAAVHDVENRNCTYRQASERYGVPVAVIYNRINGRKVSLEKLGAGRSIALSLETEEQIVLCLKARSLIGFPCDKEELKDLVGEYVKVNNLVTPFKNNRPGEDWYQSFMKRNSSLTLQKPEHLQKTRKTARDPFIVYDFYEHFQQKTRKTARDPFIVYDFYDKLNTLFVQHNVMEDSKAAFIFNCDESGFSSDPSRLRGIGEKGKPLCRISGGSGRESTSVLLCIS
ncbi:hypothetical protein QE152_g21928 [Popillia japonica]|uniref:HTH psq-type domain-containing protein n=1 Tax=Popillia japonica TaxID=7064 RepID=A0AAW1KMD0_POPJA